MEHSGTTTASDGVFMGVSQARAAHLNKKSHKRREEEIQSTKRALMERLEKQYGKKFYELRASNMGTLWREFVTNRNDAEAFLEVMYPQFPKQVQLAYVDMFERAVRGEIQLEEPMKYDKDVDDAKQATIWDPLKDIELERQAGLINLTNKRMDELLRDEATAHEGGFN